MRDEQAPLLWEVDGVRPQLRLLVRLCGLLTDALCTAESELSKAIRKTAVLAPDCTALKITCSSVLPEVDAVCPAIRRALNSLQSVSAALAGRLSGTDSSGFPSS